jgi:hypothetical protein
MRSLTMPNSPFAALGTVGCIFMLWTACGPVTTSTTYPAPAEKAAAFVAAASADPGVLGVAVGEAQVRTAEGNNQRQLMIQVRVDDRTLDDEAARTALDNTIKRQAKALYPEINAFDWVNLDFIVVNGVGPFTASRRFGTPRMLPHMIPDEPKPPSTVDQPAVTGPR